MSGSKETLLVPFLAEDAMEEASSVCTDSISFASARSAITQLLSKENNDIMYPLRPQPSVPSARKSDCDPIGFRLSVLPQTPEEDLPTNSVFVKKSMSTISFAAGLSPDFQSYLYSARCPRPCFCWKRSFFGCSYCESRFCWTWPAFRSQPYYSSTQSRHSSFSRLNELTSEPPPSRQRYNKVNFRKSVDERGSGHLTKISFYKDESGVARNRLVMEEAERKVVGGGGGGGGGGERGEHDWRRSERSEVERSGGGLRGDLAATLQVKRSWLHHNSRLVTTTAVLEGARHISSPDGPPLNGLLPTRGETGGGRGETRRSDSLSDDDKPPKLVVNLSQSDKASQIPEPLPTPELDDPEPKKTDETDGNPEPENSCLVDCLYVTLQCCDCSIM